MINFSNQHRWCLLYPLYSQNLTTRKPKLWERYLDDSIAIIPKDKVDSFHLLLNKINPYIKFTFEMKTNIDYRF